MAVRRYDTDDGIPIFHERLSHLHSAHIGVWVRVGSRHETPDEYGITHLVEHMLFKGTDARSSSQIAETLEFVGGEANAFTSREHSCFWVRVSTDHLDLGMDVLFDQIARSTFDRKEFQRERRIILDEIRMYDENPEDLCAEAFVRTAFDDELGHPITGTPGSVRHLDRDRTFDYYHRHYGPGSLFLTVVGNVTPEQVLARAGLLRDLGGRAACVPQYEGRAIRSGVRVVRRSGEQLHLCLGWEGLPLGAADRYVLHLIHTYLGSGMGSRLFQEIRVKGALAYNTYSFLHAFSGIGLFGIYCGSRPSRVGAVLDVVRREIDRVRAGAIDEETLHRLKLQIRGGLCLSMERPGFRMTRLGVCFLNFRRIQTVEELLATIDRITVADVARLAGRLFEGGPRVVAAVGDIRHQELVRRLRENSMLVAA